MFLHYRLAEPHGVPQEKRGGNDDPEDTLVADEFPTILPVELRLGEDVGERFRYLIAPAGRKHLDGHLVVLVHLHTEKSDP